ncbi:MAG: cell wall hydrolase [Bacilli bacterium]|nr:cell wall hydrolase [Bacilli bacterium]
MRRTVSNLLVIGSQFLIVGLFFTTVFSNDIKVERYVNTIHNENLDKIATSVSLLFEEEKISDIEEKLEEMVIEELPSIDEIVADVNKEEEEKNEEVTEEVESVPLYSIDAGKYISNESMGFIVTEDNKHYNLSDDQFDVVAAVVSSEFDKNLNDALAVVSVILNRCDSDKWVKWAGASPYDQVIKKGQFEVYSSGSYLSFMPGGSRYGTEKYEIAKQALIDGLNGIRNNEYLGFRAWWISSYSDKYIVSGGNRYGYN